MGRVMPFPAHRVTPRRLPLARSVTPLPLPDGLCPGRKPGVAHPAAASWADAKVARDLERLFREDTARAARAKAERLGPYADLRDGALVRQPRRMAWREVAMGALAGAFLLGAGAAAFEGARGAQATLAWIEAGTGQ